MSSPVISVSHLKRGFKSGSGSITVLKDISLTVNRGEFVAVMGASGSGKSTLLNVLGGLLAPDSGTVTVDGMDLGSMSDASLTVYRRDRVGFIFQMFGHLERGGKHSVAVPGGRQEGGPRRPGRHD